MDRRLLVPVRDRLDVLSRIVLFESNTKGMRGVFNMPQSILGIGPLELA